MSKIKSLADQLRDQMALPSPVAVPEPVVPLVRKKKTVQDPKSSEAMLPEILTRITAYDSSSNKSMMHVKLDAHTAKVVGHFKMATGIDHIKLGAFAVKYLFDTHPELKTYIKNFIQNLDL